MRFIQQCFNIMETKHLNSTDAKIRSLYCTITKIGSSSHFLTSSSITPGTPPPIILYSNNKASVHIIKQNKMYPCACHLDIPETYSFEKLQH